MAVIEVADLLKRFDRVVALNRISFSVNSGEIFGFLGPNGAGKTTTINILTTLLKPTSGKALVAGFDVTKHRDEVRSSIGLVFQETTLDDSLTAFENLEFHGILYGMGKSIRRTRIDEMFKVVNLEDVRHALVKTFSGGMKRRLEIARGLMHRPRVLFLDEPTLGLDVQTRIHLWDYIKELRKTENITIFLTTHYMDEAEHADRIAVIDYGSIIALDTPRNLKDKVGHDTIRISTENTNATKDILASQYAVDARQENGELIFQIRDGAAFIPIFLKTLPFTVYAISLVRPTLEDVFVKLTGHAIRSSGRDPLGDLRKRVKLGRKP